MNSPKLDGRTVSDVLTLIEEKSRAYTPEWKFNANDPDGGTALAMLFSEMFCGTVDRLDRFPDKCSLEFLNLIGVSAKPAAPALGVAAAQLASGTPTACISARARSCSLTAAATGSYSKPHRDSLQPPE